MVIDLLYGHTGLTVELPDSTQVIQSTYTPGLPNESQAIEATGVDPANITLLDGLGTQ